MKPQIVLKLCTQSCHQLISIKISSRLKAHGCPLLVDLISRLHIHINPHAKDNVTNVRRIPHQLKQDAGDLFLSHQDIIRPFQARLSDPHITQGMHDRKSDDQAQPFDLPHAAVNAQHQAVIEVFGKRTDPLTTTTTATSGLSLGQNHERRRRPTLDQTQRLGVGRVDSIKDMDGPLMKAFCVNLCSIQKHQRLSQLIPPTSNLMNRQPYFCFQVLQLLPYSTTADTQRSTQRLP
ncbi:Hypothetical protein PSF113_5316 [Pseudomonas ogarae]|nr:Hypothetical protein PSF113_5316 [Pseudomonas ogarae]